MLPPISASDHCQIEFSIFSPINLLNAPVIGHDPSADDNIYAKLNELPICDWNMANFDALIED